MGKRFWNKFAHSSVDSKSGLSFEDTVLPHLDAAYNLARWLTRNDQDAEDVVQEASLRALRSFATFQRGRPARAWLLQIVRNTCYTWLRTNRPQEVLALDGELHSDPAGTDPGPENISIQAADARMLREAIEKLQIEYRETLVMRELEGLSYKEISDLQGVPIGTVMSRLSRGRKDLLRLLRTPASGVK